jgi:hypothetical protein
MSTQDFAVVQALEELVAFLHRFDERHWSSKIEDDVFFLRRGDAYGAKRFLSYFGGMGSLNDVWLCSANGNPVADDSQSKVNAELGRLKEKAWQLANDAAKSV